MSSWNNLQSSWHRVEGGREENFRCFLLASSLCSLTLSTYYLYDDAESSSSFLSLTLPPLPLPPLCPVLSFFSPFFSSSPSPSFLSVFFSPPSYMYFCICFLPTFLPTSIYFLSTFLPMCIYWMPGICQTLCWTLWRTRQSLSSLLWA